MRRTFFRRCAAVVMAAVLAVGGGQPFTEVKESKAATKITDTSQYYNKVTKNRVSVHDPSIVVAADSGSKGTSKHKYYIFGSHLAWAYSDDLVTWTTFTNNISSNYNTLFANEFDWAKQGDSTYDSSGNMWAPDIIWNKDMNKWCMYMSINGNSWNSCICMLTADSLDGNWTYVGPVVYSGFTASGVHTYESTDYKNVTGDTSLAERYQSNSTTWNMRYGAHAIDPCVYYDEDGKLRFVYGSWSGGIWTFELDEKTGFRDKNVTYAYSTTDNTDPYMGKKLGGSTSSGEAPYIQYINGYYYLFLSYGGLVANGGYNMRVFRSESPEGPFVDAVGNKALQGGSVNGNIGTRLMSYYKWSYWENAQVAQGHNSAFVDKDGNAFVIYHTRTDDGTEIHTVRVHQLFTTSKGLVAAPFEYNTTDTVKSTYTAKEIAGDYEILFQYNTDNSKLEYNEPKNVTFSEDGKVTGDVTGTWEETQGEATVKITLGTTTYEGTFVEQTMEGTDVKTLCFTTVGTDNICLWGAKYPKDASAVSMAASALYLPPRVSDDIELPTTGLMGTTITWESDSPFVLKDGTVIQPNGSDVTATLTATVTRGDCSYEKKIKIVVATDTEEDTKAYSYYEDGIDFTKESAVSIDNPLKGADLSKGVTFKFDVERTGAYYYLENANIFGFQGAGGDGKLYFTGGSYFGYNAAGGLFDANLYHGNYSPAWQSGTDYIGQNKKVTIEIKLTGTGFTVSMDGEKLYDNTMIDKNLSVTEGEVPGQCTVTDFTKVLEWLSSSAETLQFGSGSWWTGAFKGTLSNFEIWLPPMEKKAASGNTYYSEDYESGTAITKLWSGNATVSKESADGGHYAKFAPNGSGNRYASAEFGLESGPEGVYEFSADVCLTPSAGNNGSTTPNQIFAVTGEDVVLNGADVTSGYILKLSAQGVNNTTYTINDSAEDTVVIPSGEWVTVQILKDESSKYYLTITKSSNGTEILKNKQITPNGEANIAGMFVGVGRGTNSSILVDNVLLKNPSIADYATLNSTMSLAAKYVKQSEEYPIYSEESVKALKKALTAAQALSTDLTDEQQSQIDSCVKALQEALDGLVCKEHAWDEGVKVDGVTTYTCVYCGETKTDKGGESSSEGGENASEDKNTDAVNDSGNNSGSSSDSNNTNTDGKRSSSGQNGNTDGEVETTPGPGTLDEPLVGTTYTVGSYKYKVLSLDAKTVALTGVKKKTIKKVTVPKTVKIKGVTFRVTTIGASAFAKCKKLKKATIGANVTSIGKKAFFKDSKLKTITIKSKYLTKVGAKAFKGINKRAKIKVPKSEKKAYKKLLKKKGQAKTVKIK